MRLLNKTAAAFTFSAERLFEQHEKVYFWTFTFVSVPMDDETAMEDYDLLHKRLKKHFLGIKGLRVCELHRSHGIHFHLLLNRRIAIDRMRRIMRGSFRLVGHNRYLDFGRISVSKCGKETIGYLGNYLTKEYRKRHSFGGRRRWGTVGGFVPYRVRDIVFDSPATRNRSLLFGNSRCRFATHILIQHYSMMWGHLKNWPAEHRAVVERQTGPGATDWMKQRRKNEPF